MGMELLIALLLVAIVAVAAVVLVSRLANRMADQQDYVVGELVQQSAQLADRLMSRTLGEYRSKPVEPVAVKEAAEDEEEDDVDSGIITFASPAQTLRPVSPDVEKT